MRMIGGLVLAVMLPFASGCSGVVTTQPLSDPVTAEPDESLYGHWVHKDKFNNSNFELHLFVGKHDTPDNPESLMEVVAVEVNLDTKSNDLAFRIK